MTEFSLLSGSARQLKEQHYCQLFSLSMAMGRTATDFGGHLIATSTVPVFSRYQRAQILDAIYAVGTTDNRLDFVSVFVFFWGKTEDHGTIFFMSDRKVQPYINTVIEYGHFRLKIAGISRLTVSYNIIIVVNCRCSVGA